MAKPAHKVAGLPKGTPWSKGGKKKGARKEKNLAKLTSHK